MADIIWGSGDKGQIGIATSTTHTDTITTVRADVYFRSKWSVRDSVNNFYLQFYEGGQFSIGSFNINHPSNSSWNASNQTYLGYWTGGFRRTKSQQTGTCKAWYNAIEAVNNGEVSANFTVPAIPSYTVYYHANGGSGAPNSQTKWYGENLTLSTTKPTRTGYDFVGWGTASTDTTVKYNAGGTYSNNYSSTLYAIWKANTYPVTYDANGGENAPSGQTKTYGVNLTLSNQIPTRKDYNFLGWSANGSATEPTYSAGAVYTSNAGVTLYAVWELAYIKPRITNVTVERNLDGVADDFGTECRIKFDWEVDRDSVFYAVYYKKTTESESGYKSAQRLSLNGTKGSVDTLIYIPSGNVEFDTDYSYDIRLNVTDSNGYNTVEKILNAVFLPIDFSPEGKNVSFGEPAKDTTVENGVFRVAYTNIDLAPKNRLLYKGEVMFGQKELWSGNSVMNETHSITLSKKISEMKNGILLVFGRDGAYNIMAFFVPKQSVVSYGRAGWTFLLCTTKFEYIGTKTIYISDGKLEGHTDNKTTGKSDVSGITYHNEAFYLKYVYEV